jgi:hypothetical protein
VCMFCDRAGHLDEFCFHRKRIEKIRFEYVRNSYRDEFFDFPPRSYYHALPHTSSRALPTGGSHTHFEQRHLDGPCLPHHGSCPTQSSDVVQKTVKTSSGRMVKCWVPKIYLTNPSSEPSTSSHSM